MTRKLFATLAAGAAALVFASGAALAQSVTLTLAHQYPSTQPIGDGYNLWAERVEELRNPEARKPRAAVPAHAQTGNGKSNFAGKPSPAGKSKKKKFYASKPKGK